ncbi:MAG: reverse transcriptase family protein [Terriglobales bacterium]|jgi:retron-type reverse transcriptase
MPRCKLFSISNTAQLATLLKVSPGEINHLVSRLDRQYLRRPRRKLDGTKRILFVPSDPLKLLQRKIYDHILSKVPLLPCVLGGVKGKSPIQNAAIHTNKPVVFKMDIAQCFPSISPGRVQAIFQTLGFGPEATGLLTKLTTWHNEIPQGAPTSNALANLALLRIDFRITRLKEQQGFDYSRWVDDLTFSGPERVLKFRGLLQRIVESEGFNVKPDKTKTELAKDRQTVTNFVVNTKVNLSREKRSAIKKEVMMACVSGQELSPSTAGKMYWLRAVNPETGSRLVKRALSR